MKANTPTLLVLCGACGLTSCTTAPPPSPAASAAATGASAAPNAPAPSPAPPPSAAPAPAPATAAGTPPVGHETADALVGRPAPDFTATAQDGTTVHLAALKGKPVVVYFYPKDETAGCTKEACSFRDAWDAIAKTGAVLIGVSADDAESHKAFTAHHKLPFLLVSDPDGHIARLFGVAFQGRHHRESFVIAPDGTVRKAYREVDVNVHAQQILDDLTHRA
ncbi:MAG TPA: peroxiredoxin [Polyangiaceae bacterium]|nr:peroxiredoxin [Polyangiaceae bacterium]